MSTNSALSKYKFLGLFPLVMAQIGTSGDKFGAYRGYSFPAGQS